VSQQRHCSQESGKLCYSTLHQAGTVGTLLNSAWWLQQL
jgi:hypothetical protein